MFNILNYFSELIHYVTDFHQIPVTVLSTTSFWSLKKKLFCVLSSKIHYIISQLIILVIRSEFTVMTDDVFNFFLKAVATTDIRNKMKNGSREFAL